MEFEDESIIDALAEAAGKEDADPAVINPVRMRDMRKAELLMNEVARENRAKIKSVYNEPFKTMGSIELEAKEIHISNVREFLQALLLADNLDVYPLTTGKIKMDLGFHRIAIRVMEDDL